MTTTTQTPMKATKETVDKWATDPSGPVALHLRQKLLPVEGVVEGYGAVFFPPTYAGAPGREGGYNIDELWDGRSVATVDSVGSQANRMEPLFKEKGLEALVPQITIAFDDQKSVSLLEVGHRIADAAVRNTDGYAQIRTAFDVWQTGDTGPIAKLAPTSIVFGVWDSRGGGAKLPRIVQSVIRAWDVKKLHRSAQYIPPVDYSELEGFQIQDTGKAAEHGYSHVPNEGPGGIVARGPIFRDVTVNLVALRRLRAAEPDKLKRYILGLSLVAATRGFDGLLRQGCLLTLDPADKPSWHAVHRDGTRTPLDVNDALALDYAHGTAKAFGVGPNQTFKFDLKKAQADVTKTKESKTKGKSPKEAITVDAPDAGDGH